MIEILISMSILSVLFTIGLMSYSGIQRNVRDTQRIADIVSIKQALFSYYSANGRFPAVNPAAQDVGGWEVSYKAGFLASLVPSFLKRSTVDPINQLGTGFSFFGPKSGSYFYAYYNYPAANAKIYGCDFNSSFAVIAVRQLESGKKSDTPRAQCGTFPAGGCPGGGIVNVCRDWSTEFDYSAIVTP